MKQHILIAAVLALICTGCEMRDELTNHGTTGPNGELAVKVMADMPGAMSRAQVNTDNFEVEITGKEAQSDYSHKYESVAAMPAKITLPVGTYTVSAHTAGALDRMMTAPYYLGETTVEIEEGITSNKEVACTMANSRITVKYSDEFLGLFDTWTITIDDGTDQALYFDEKETEPADVFWYFKNETKNLKVNIRAVTKKGNNVESSATYNKRNSEEGYTQLEKDYFTGGDALTINFLPIESGTTTGTVNTISIVNDITFDDNGESVTLHLKDTNTGSDPSTPANPSNPSTDPITITEPNGTSYLTDGVVYKQYYTEVDAAGVPYYLNYPEDVALHFEIPAGLAHLYVLISGSDDFEFMTSLMGLTEAPYGLDLTDTTNENVQEIQGMDLFSMPVAGMKSYDFAFSEGIWRLLPGFVGKQSFKLRAEDADGNVKEATLVVTINEMD